MTTYDYTEELPLKAAEALVNVIESRLKKDISDEVRESLRKSLEKMKEFYETTLRESSAKQNQTIEMLKDRLLSYEAVRAEPTQEAARAEEKLKTALQDKDEIQARLDEAEKKFHQTNNSNETLNAQLNFYKDELSTAVTLAESFLSEKTELEKKLAELQEHRENHLANSQDKP